MSGEAGEGGGVAEKESVSGEPGRCCGCRGRMLGTARAELEVVVMMCLCIPSPESNCILNHPLQAGKLPVCCPCPRTGSDSAGNTAFATLSLLICF